MNLVVDLWLARRGRYIYSMCACATLGSGSMDGWAGAINNFMNLYNRIHSCVVTPPQGIPQGTPRDPPREPQGLNVVSLVGKLYFCSMLLFTFELKEAIIHLVFCLFGSELHGKR